MTQMGSRAFDVAQIAVVDEWLTKKKDKFCLIMINFLKVKKKLPEYAFFYSI